MKKIFLVQRGEFLWGRIEYFLQSINAETFCLREEADMRRLQEDHPDLIIAADGCTDFGELFSRNTPVIIFDIAGSLSLPQEYARSHRLIVLTWPITKRAFLETTAELLSLSPRRIFRAVVRVGRPNEGHGGIAESRDFSVTGMSFTSDRYFTVSTKVVISLALPQSDQRLVLPGRIVRTFNDDDGSMIFGVEFFEPDQDMRMLLENFVFS